MVTCECSCAMWRKGKLNLTYLMNKISRTRFYIEAKLHCWAVPITLILQDRFDMVCFSFISKLNLAVEIWNCDYIFWLYRNFSPVLDLFTCFIKYLLLNWTKILLTIRVVCFYIHTCVNYLLYYKVCCVCEKCFCWLYRLKQIWRARVDER